MRYLLDTNVCVMYLNGHSSLVRDHLPFVPFEDRAVCSVVKAEFLHGVLRSNNPTQTLEEQQKFIGRFVSLPFGMRRRLSTVKFGRVLPVQELRLVRITYELWRSVWQII